MDETERFILVGMIVTVAAEVEFLLAMFLAQLAGHRLDTDVPAEMGERISEQIKRLERFDQQNPGQVQGITELAAELRRANEGRNRVAHDLVHLEPWTGRWTTAQMKREYPYFEERPLDEASLRQTFESLVGIHKDLAGRFGGGTGG